MNEQFCKEKQEKLNFLFVLEKGLGVRQEMRVLLFCHSCLLQKMLLKWTGLADWEFKEAN